MRLSLFLLLLAPALQAMQAYTPPAAVAASSDLVLTATVLEQLDEGEHEIHLPGTREPVTRFLRRFRLRVEAVLLGEAQRGQELTVVVLARKPQPKRQGVLAVMSDGPGYPSLRKGQTYGVALQALDKQALGDFYLPAQSDYFAHVDVPQQYNRLVRITNVAAWPWGPARNGLQLALVPDLRSLPIMRRNGQPAATFPFAVAARNVGEEPLALVHHQDFLALGYRPADGDWQQVKEQQRRQPRAFKAAEHVTVLQPGEMLLLARHGATQYGDRATVTGVTAGPVAWKAIYRNQRADELDGVPFWQGKLQSALSSVTLVQR